MDEDVKAILAELARAINDGLLRSKNLDASVRKLEALGYEMSIVLEATVLLSREEPVVRTGRSRRPTRRIRSGSLSLSEKDLKFLKSLKIGVQRKTRKGAAP